MRIHKIGAFVSTLAIVLAGVLSFAQAGLAAVDEAKLSRLINEGKIQEAQAEVLRSEASDADRLFYNGLVLKASGNLQPAILMFREALRLEPQRINARRELAHTLLLAGDIEVAEFHFRELLKVDSDPHFRTGYLQFLNVISQNKPTKVNTTFALLPSTNINRGTFNTVTDSFGNEFTIQDGRAVSGIGARLGVGGYYRNILSRKSRLVFNWNIAATKYSNSDFDQATLSLSVPYERANKKTFWSLGPYFRKTVRSADTLIIARVDSAIESRGLAFSFNQAVSDKNRLALSLGSEIRGHSDNTYNDGTFTYGTLSLSRQLDPSLTISAGYGFDFRRVNTFNGTMVREDLNSDTGRIFVGLSKVWKGGLQTSFGAHIGRRDFNGDDLSIGVPREDEFFGLNFSVRNTKLNYRGFTPRMSCSYSNQRSNSAFGDFNATECQLSISRNF